MLMMVAVLYTGFNSVLFEAQPPWSLAQNRVRLHSLHTRAHAGARAYPNEAMCRVSSTSQHPRPHAIPPGSTLAICCTFQPPPLLSSSLAQTPQNQITLSLQASSSPNLLLSNKCRPPLSLQLAPPVLFSCPSTPSRPSPSSYPPSTKAACLPRWPQSQPKCANGL